MKTSYSRIRLIAILIIVTGFFSKCEIDNFPLEYHDMCGTWIIRNISGGYTGG
ncbi:MAG: hypothetical protein MUO72_06450 [Bacteroidales bacterium]|nr:hypothetical protein [Bacteroidales bacterium]